MEVVDLFGYITGLAAAVGYIKAQLRDITEELKEIKTRIKNLEDKDG